MMQMAQERKEAIENAIKESVEAYCKENNVEVDSDLLKADQMQRGKTIKVNSDDDSEIGDEAGEEMMAKLRKSNRKSKKTVAIEMLKMIKSNKLDTK